MKKKSNVLFTLFAIGALLQPATAVIVGGSSGTGNNNNTQAGLDSYLSTASLDAFPYWENLIQFNSASGVYLGYNASTQRGWVLSADHVTSASTVTIAGNTYTVSGSGTLVGSTDMRLFEIGGDITDPALPSLPSIPLASILASSSETALMLGRGYTSDTSSPYSWVSPGTSAANGIRWGSNTVEFTATVNLGTAMAPNLQPYIVTDFDDSGDAGATEFDAQGATGDSGGGIFVLRSGVWELAGIAHFVDDGPDFLEEIATGDDTVNPSEYGDFTAYSDVFSKVSTINGITGTLIPEPGSTVLTLLACLTLHRRKR